MAQFVSSGATVTCTFGTAPGTITVTSQAKCMMEGKPAATIQEVQASNITPFGLCTSLINPQVAAATAAALGVLTPQPCMLMAAGPWIPTKPAVMLGGKPCLTNDCKLMCGNGGGTISIVVPGQIKVNAT